MTAESGYRGLTESTLRRKVLSLSASLALYLWGVGFWWYADLPWLGLFAVFLFATAHNIEKHT